jgi:hypothetical protein
VAAQLSEAEIIHMQKQAVTSIVDRLTATVEGQGDKRALVTTPPWPLAQAKREHWRWHPRNLDRIR